MRLKWIVLLITVPFAAQAQNEVDALRYSRLGFGGTSRHNAMAGSMSVIGGDVSAMHVNPAGLARFTKSEFTLSFNYLDFASDAVFNGSSHSNGKGNFNLSNIALVGALKTEQGSDWRSVQLGLAYTRLNNFNNRSTISGVNNTSLLDVFAHDAAGIPENYLIDDRPFTSGPAYWAYLIDPLDTNAHTYGAALPLGADVKQTRTTNRSGGMGETAISFSGNYMDKVYLGMTVGFPGVRYSETYNHQEEVLDPGSDLESFNYRTSLTTRGTGINAKFGIIVAPTDWIRLGVALHTASGISLSDRWSSTIRSQFRDGKSYQEESVLGEYNYRVRTPGRYIGSIGFVIGRYGLISADYEYVDYRRARLRPEMLTMGNPYNFGAENQAIRDSYQATSNIRIGGELRLNPFALRAGYAIYGSPYREGTTDNNAVRTSYSAGIGYRNNFFYVDATYVLTEWAEDFFLYDPQITNAAIIKNHVGLFSLSMGVRF